MPELKRILIVDDDHVSREMLSEILAKAGFRPSVAESAEQALELQRAAAYPLILSDIRMLELSGLDLLRQIKSGSPNTVVVLMTGFGSVDGALEAIREGAFDYLSKPFQMDELRQVIARAAKHHDLLVGEGANTTIVSAAASAVGPAQGLLGRTPKIVEIYKLIARAALSTSSVLITGEPGTGKALIAQTIHQNSGRRERPLITLSQEDLDLPHLESRIEEAKGGTIVLEEIDGLSATRQVKLVRALEFADRNHLDLRWMALSRKTYRDLSEDDGLRRDLLYPLSVVVVEIPPLRERQEDLPEMISATIAKYNERNGKAVSHVSKEAMNLLTAHSWPGNLREFERVIERAVTLSNTSVLDVDDFRDQIHRDALSIATTAAEATSTESSAEAQSLVAVEKRHISNVLRMLAFNKSRAAEALGIDRATLYRKAKLYGINLQREKKVNAE